MASWLFELWRTHQSDFWLNVLAGLPFALFDIIIITMLLPVTLRWWDERAWRRTRLNAIARLLQSYRYPLAGFKPLPAIDQYVDMAGVATIDRDRNARYYASHLSEILHGYLARADMEIQTALPILSPKMTQDILDFHYALKIYVEDLARFADNLADGYGSQYIQNHRARAVRGIFDVHASLHLEGTEALLSQTDDILLRYARLSVTYARDDADIFNLWIGGLLAPENFLQKIAAYSDRSMMHPEARPFRQEDVSNRWKAIQAMLEEHPPVVVHIHDNLLGRISGKRLSKMAKPLPPEMIGVIKC